MAEILKNHPVTPHRKRIFEATDRLKAGDIALFPTDSHYALGCIYDNRKGVERIRRIRHLTPDHLFTLMCDSMSGLSRFALITDENFKIIKRLVPGPYTFVLPATKEVPKLLLNPKRKTIGFRIPDYPICQDLLSVLGTPLLSTSAHLREPDDDDSYYTDRVELIHQFEKRVDLIIDDQQKLKKQGSTVIDMTDGNATILRPGLGIAKAEDVFSRCNKELVR